MRVLVCGGRNYTDHDHIWNTLCELDQDRGPFKVVIHGCATGADREGMLWAQGMRRKHAPFQAAWSDLTHHDAVIKLRYDGTRYDAMAGFRRNQRMLDEGKPVLVIAFPGGNGTADMIRRAEKAGLEVIKIKPKKKKLERHARNHQI